MFSLFKEPKPAPAPCPHEKGISENFPFKMADGSFEVVPALSLKPREMTGKKKKKIHSPTGSPASCPSAGKMVSEESLDAQKPVIDSAVKRQTETASHYTK